MYQIQGHMTRTGTARWEVIDEFGTKQEAVAMLKEYRMAYGNQWVLRIIAK